jgi:hypothetical protein
MKLHRPISIMTVGGADHPKTYWIDCPIDVWPSQECRRIEIPRELCRYIMSLEREIDEVAEQAAEIAEQIDEMAFQDTARQKLLELTSSQAAEIKRLREMHQQLMNLPAHIKSAEVHKILNALEDS